MRRILLSLALLALLSPGWVAACPSCREAVSQTSSVEEEDQTREALSYNRSIYLMLAVPYLAVGVVGLCLYRGLSRRERE